MTLGYSRKAVRLLSFRSSVAIWAFSSRNGASGARLTRMATARFRPSFVFALPLALFAAGSVSGPKEFRAVRAWDLSFEIVVREKTSSRDVTIRYGGKAKLLPIDAHTPMWSAEHEGVVNASGSGMVGNHQRWTMNRTLTARGHARLLALPGVQDQQHELLIVREGEEFPMDGSNMPTMKPGDFLDTGGSWSLKGAFEEGAHSQEWSHGSAKWVATWKLTPHGRRKKDEDLQAIIRAPGASRGSTSTLDGSGSKGKPVSWRWRIGPGADCPEGARFEPIEREGRTTALALLCSVEVTLTVADAEGKTKETYATVRPKARPWKTTVNWRTSPQAFDHVPMRIGVVAFGNNVCAIDETDYHPINDADSYTRHWVHTTDPEKRTWHGDGSGYRLATVNDPEGPFHGLAYVEAADLRIDRLPMFNADLVGGELHEHNIAQGIRMKRIANSTRDHEAMHSTLAKDAAKAFAGEKDPARVIERLIAADEDTLRTLADIEIRWLETALTEASTEERVAAALIRKTPSYAEGGEFHVRDGNGGWALHRFASYARKGE